MISNAGETHFVKRNSLLPAIISEEKLQFRTAIRLLSGTQPRERKFLHVRELHDRISLIAADRGACVYVEFYWMESISAVDSMI